MAVDFGQAPAPIRRAFEDYFAGDIRALERVPVATVGTAFQRKVWAALQRIPAGETRSYGQLAAEIGLPKAMRAVGLANGQNPIAIVIPCHRVIGADGSLTGFGGGLPRKRWLLRHEGAAFKENRARTRRRPRPSCRSRAERRSEADLPGAAGCRAIWRPRSRRWTPRWWPRRGPPRPGPLNPGRSSVAFIAGG